METTEAISEVQLSPLKVVQDYLHVLRGRDMAAYESAQGVTDDIFFNNTPESSSTENHTWHTLKALNNLEHGEALGDPKLIKALQNDFDNWRIASACHVVRAMIQGNKFPVEDFGQVINMSLLTIRLVQNTLVQTEKQRRYVRHEIRDAMSAETRPDILRRGAEAYKFVGKPRIFGRMMARVAKLEAQTAL